MDAFFTPIQTAGATIEGFEAFGGTVKGRVERLRKSRRCRRRPHPDGMLFKSVVFTPSSPAPHSIVNSMCFHSAEKLRIFPSCGYEGVHSSLGAGFEMPFFDIDDGCSIDSRHVLLLQKPLGGSGSLSPTYAGARFSDAPSPKVLPPPPRHWVSDHRGGGPPLTVCSEMTHYLKTVLRVQ